MRRTLVVAAAMAVLAGTGSASADDHTPSLSCGTPIRYFFTEVLFRGEAHANVGHVPLVLLTLTCEYEGEHGWLTRSATTTAPVVSVTGPGEMALTDWYYVCGSASATYADGHVATVPRTCADNAVDAGNEFDPVPAEPDPAYAACDHERESRTHTWVLAATAVARASRGVPSTTSVACSVRDAEGREMTVEGSQNGDVAVATGAVPAAIAKLATKCVTASVRYPTGAASFEQCEPVG